MRDFPKDVLVAHKKLSNDLTALEAAGQENPYLKTILRFIESLEITDGTVKYTGTDAAADNPNPQASPISALLRKDKPESEREARSESGLQSALPREAVGALQFSIIALEKLGCKISLSIEYDSPP